MSTFLLAIGFGVVTASILALAAVSVSLQVSVTNFVNFAYGDYMTFGAYVVWVTSTHGLNFFAAVAVGCVATGVLGVVGNVVVFRPLVRRQMRPVTLLVAGLAISFIIENVITIIWGGSPQVLPVSTGNALHIGPFLFTPGELILIGVSAGLLALLHVSLQYTKLGKALRATANNFDLARVCGIDTDRVINGTWFVGGILTAIAGVGFVLEEGSLGPTTGIDQLFVVFGAVILGGIGRPYGAMAGALIVGIITELAAMYVNAAYASSIAFGVVIVLLLMRPQGLISAVGKTF